MTERNTEVCALDFTLTPLCAGFAGHGALFEGSQDRAWNARRHEIAGQLVDADERDAWRHADRLGLSELRRSDAACLESSRAGHVLPAKRVPSTKALLAYVV